MDALKTKYDEREKDSLEASADSGGRTISVSGEKQAEAADVQHADKKRKYSRVAKPLKEQNTEMKVKIENLQRQVGEMTTEIQIKVGVIEEYRRLMALRATQV